MTAYSYHASLAAALGLLLAAEAFPQFTNDFGIEFHGAGWMQAGTIVSTSDTVTSKNNYAGNYIENTGALFNMRFQFNPELDGALGIGAIKAHNPMGSFNIGNVEGVQLGNFSFINMARMTYTRGGTGSRSPFSLTTGSFNYKYDDNIKNLGLYLIRGSVYPQILQSGFESKEMIGSANMLGAHMRNCFGEFFTQDLLLVSETDLKPKYDFSFLYIATLKLGAALELGGGVNFYHYLPVRGEATSPSDKHFNPDDIQGGGKPDPLDRKYAIDRDTALDGTVSREWYSHKGIKVGARFAFDPKALLSTAGPLGPNDLKVYGEAAIIGLKSYDLIYKDRAERIPVMMGFNIPTFGFLDELAFEIEYFNSPYMPDYAKIMEFSSPVPRSPYWNRSPGDSTAKPYGVGGDDWKWSLYASKVLAGHVKLSAQVARDHYRIGSQQPWFPTYDETLTDPGEFGVPGDWYNPLAWIPGDWYMMGKLTFFF